jgi:diguanylate cyclase (GGDEF)-like protein/PAS domain S-box-containing protein
MAPSSSNKLPSTLAAYADLFERLLDPIFLVDPADQTILELNPAAERILGDCPTSEDKSWVGCCIAEVVIPAQKAEFIKAVRVSSRRFHSRRFESVWMAQAEDGSSTQALNIEVHACPLQLSAGKTVLQIIARDITARRRMEQKVRELLFKLKDANERLKALSGADEVTGLKNFRHFLKASEAIHTEAVRNQGEYAVVAITVDHLKHYEDRNGLQAADALLFHVASVLNEQVRKNDVLVKRNEDSFILACPGLASNDAQQFAERLRTSVAGASFPNSEHQPNGSVTLSVGVAAFPEHGGNLEHLVEVAERAVASSIRKGRNRVTVGALSAKAA